MEEEKKETNSRLEDKIWDKYLERLVGRLVHVAGSVSIASGCNNCGVMKHKPTEQASECDWTFQNKSKCILLPRKYDLKYQVKGLLLIAKNVLIHHPVLSK